MPNGQNPLPRRKAEMVVFFAFVVGCAASAVLKADVPRSALLLSIIAAAPLILLAAPSLIGVYLIPAVCAASGLCVTRYISAEGLARIPVLCLLVPLIFIAAASGMEISGRVRMCCARRRSSNRARGALKYFFTCPPRAV
ncbi:MAG: hypothetical protein V8S72_06670 [Oscillospiraceae bacterium]